MGAVLLFGSFRLRDAFRHAAGLYIGDADQFNDAHKIFDTRIEPYCAHANGTIVYLAVPSTSEGIVGFVNLSCCLMEAFCVKHRIDPLSHLVYVYHDNGAAVASLFGNRVTGVNVSTAVVARALGLVMERGSDAMNAQTQHMLGSPMRITFRRTRRRVYDYDQEDTEYHLALRESERLDQEIRAEAANVRIPFKREWSDIARETADEIVKGQPKCVVCKAKRATICFVECNHQAVCDECVREIWTRTDVKHECPVCRTPCAQIVRPMVVETATCEDVDVEVERPCKFVKKE